MYQTTVLIPAQVKAVSVTGQIVTVHVDGEIYQGKVVSVEGETWTTVHADTGEVVVDTDCTYLGGHQDPTVCYTWQTPWGQSINSWAKLSQVRRGVSLAKCAK